MRRRANMWAMGHAAPKPIVFPEAEGPVLPEGNNTSLHTCRLGEERGVSGGVFDHGTYEEDGPVTWEALASPRHIPVLRRAGDPSPRLCRKFCSGGREEANTAVCGRD